MKNRIAGVCGLLMASVFCCAVAHAQVGFALIGEGMPTDISADGSVIVGITSEWETFRWTKQNGVVLLGRKGPRAGTPDVSDNGTKVSATIASADGTYYTWGLWTLGSGWQELMPPAPPDGSPLSGSHGSAYGLSGDGKTACGFYWASGKAHGAYWTQASGVVNLGVEFTGRNSRVDDANYDGSVLVGWDEASAGNWRPAVWVDSVRTILSVNEAFCEAVAVTPDGKMIVGQSWDSMSSTPVAAVWRWSGSEWIEELIGALPGTLPGSGLTVAHDVTADGSTVVGENRFGFNPVPSSGFVWTAAGGMIDIEDFLADNGVAVPGNIDIIGLTGISDDGNVMCGVGMKTQWPYQNFGFVIHIGDAATGVPDLAAHSELRIGENYPNPFNPSTTIPITLSHSGQTRLEVFGVNGQRVRVLHDGVLPVGTHEFRWNGTDNNGASVSSGIYFVRLTDVAGATTSRRMVLLK